MANAYILILACGVLALLYGLVTSRSVLAANAGTARMQEISGAVQVGASAYLNRQYRTIAIVGVVILIILGVALGLRVAIGYLIGAVLSGAAGYIGMNVSVRANVRTAQAARSGLDAGLDIAFKAGAVTGMLVVGLGLLGVGCYYFFLRAVAARRRTAPGARGDGGAQLRRLADLDLRPARRRHLHQGRRCRRRHRRQGRGRHPRGRPRNPAVIADNVGDNVGDCAGMAADLFETYVVTIVATMLLAAIFFAPPLRDTMMLLPLVIGAVCIVTSVIGTFFVRLGADNGIMKALYKGPDRDRHPVGRRDRGWWSVWLFGLSARCR